MSSSSFVEISALGRLAVRVLRHRRLVIVAWLVVMVCGGMAASAISSRFS